MRVTIIVDDNQVLVEGIALSVDCSALLPEDIHAVQWYGNWGEIEYFTDSQTGHRKPNRRIEEFSPFQSLLDAWEIEAQKPAPDLTARAMTA